MHYRALVERLLAAGFEPADEVKREPPGSVDQGAWAAQPPPASPGP